MKNRILIAFCAIFMTFHASSQIAVYKAKQLQAIDSIKLVNDWIKSVTKDSTFSGATDRDIPSAAAVKKHVNWSLLNYVPITRTINGYPLSASISLNKGDVGLGNVDNTSDINKPVSTAQAASIATKQATLVSGSNIKTINSNNLLGSGDISVASLIGYTPENAANKNANNGYAGLDAGGKVPFSLLPATLMIYKGLWDATTNSPSLSNGVGTAGHVYKISNSGGQYYVGNRFGVVDTLWNDDFIIYNGTAWEVSGETNNVKSVNNQQGIVTLTTANIAENTNLYYTDARVLSYGNTQWVRSVVGTAGKIFSSGGSNPTLTIDAAYNGQSSITNVGTLTIGTWNATPIADTYISSASTWNAKQAQLNGTGFVKASGTTISYDNSTYLTGNQTITLSGDISGSGTTAITTTIGASKVTNAMLAGSIDYAKMNAATVPTWNQNTTGSSDQWKGQGGNFTGLQTGGLTDGIFGRAADGTAYRFSAAAVHSFLGLGSASYNNSGDFVAFRTFGTAANNNSGDFYANGSTVLNSTLWNNTVLGTTVLSTGYAPTALYARLTGTTMHPIDQAGIREFLGLGTNAYTSTAYLPLSGGTLTGALTGTSAFFNEGYLSSGAATSNFTTTNRAVFEVNGTSTAILGYSVGGAAKGYIFHDGTNFDFRNVTTNGGISITPNGTGLISLGGALTGLSGSFTDAGTSDYILRAVATSGTGARSIFLAGKSGVSNGFTVSFNGTRMVYGMDLGDLSVGGSVTTNGEINANSVGTNIRVKGDGGTGNDLRISADGAGNFYFKNVLDTRGFTVTSSNVLVHTGAATFSGTTQSKSYNVGATPLDDRSIYVSGNSATTGTSQYASVLNPIIVNSATSIYGSYVGIEYSGFTPTNRYQIYLPSVGGSATNDYSIYSNNSKPSYFAGSITASSFIKSGGTSSQLLAADGSVITAGSGITISGSTISASGGGTVTGTTYSPTVTASTNVSSVTLLNAATYTVVGNVVTVRVAVAITPTAAGNAFFTVSLPVTAASSSIDLVGVGNYWQISNQATALIQVSVSSTNQATVVFEAPAGSAGHCYMTFSYSIP